MEVLKLCVAMGVQACAKGVPILTEELERNSVKRKAGGMIPVKMVEGKIIVSVGERAPTGGSGQTRLAASCHGASSIGNVPPRDLTEVGPVLR